MRRRLAVLLPIMVGLASCCQEGHDLCRVPVLVLCGVEGLYTRPIGGWGHFVLTLEDGGTGTLGSHVVWPETRSTQDITWTLSGSKVVIIGTSGGAGGTLEMRASVDGENLWLLDENAIRVEYPFRRIR